MSTASPPSSPDPLNRASIPPGWGDTIVLLGRILIGGIFVQSGFDKLMGLDGFGAGLAAATKPTVDAMAGGLGALARGAAGKQ